MNKTQRLQRWFDERPAWDHASYGEYMHVGANQTTFKVALHGEKIGPETKVLDTACAVGGNARWLASLYGCRVWGNDIDEPALRTARELAEIEGIAHLCTFVNARSEDLGFDDDMFDLALSAEGVFDAGEVRRVLKPGGKFAVTMFCSDPGATFESLAADWGMELELAHDVTPLAFAFHRAKEEEARLLIQAGHLQPAELVRLLNETVTPYATQGGRHLLMRVRKPGG